MSGQLIDSLALLGRHLWPGLATALALGILIGVASCGGRAHRAITWSSGLLWFLLSAAGLAAAALGWVPGRYGLWFEMAAGLFAAYGIGCSLGCALRALGARDQRPDGPPSAPA